MDDKRIHGVYAAVLTPRFDDGKVDIASLRWLVAFLRERGVQRYAVNGATGEFCLTSPEELRQILETVQEAGGAGTEILCGVGAAGINATKALIVTAQQAGVQGLLLSMPYFFPYNQSDLMAFCKEAAASTHLPVLLYNLPQFTSGLDAQTICELVQHVPNIVGVKDSSGSLDISKALTARVPDACRIMGNDSALAPALMDGICDGVVSGVACVLPEVICALFFAAPDSEAFHRAKQQVETFIEQLNVFPTPWGLKWAAQARGILQARFSLPLSDERSQQGEAFLAWMQDWLPTIPAAR